MSRTKLLIAVFIAALSINNTQAQDADLVKDSVESAAELLTQAEESSAIAVSLDQNGNLLGNTFVTGEKTPLKAKVTLANSEGVVIDTVVAGSDGSFAFTSVEPGTYNMFGTAAAAAVPQGSQVEQPLPPEKGTTSKV